MRIDPTIRLSLPTDEQILRNQSLRQQAEKFVSQAFFTPMFKAMRSSPFKNEALTGGEGGKAFQTMFDGILATRMGRGSGRPLVDAMVKRLDPHTSQLLAKLESRGISIKPPVVAPSYARQREGMPARVARPDRTVVNLRG